MRTEEEIRKIIKFSEHYLDEICFSEEDRLLMEAYIDALKWVLESEVTNENN